MEEASGSITSNFTYSGRKRARCPNNMYSAKFKGVVLQHNGHWGAQIYVNHQRIWLGTYKSEEEAAMAYDSAAIKLRSGVTHRNFPWTIQTLQEPSFQNNYTTEAVLDMIRDGSYSSHFADYLRTKAQSERKQVCDQKSGNGNLDHGGISCRQLFQKELTPSDVGKLNRLVIPKKYAVKHFPYVNENGEENVGSDGVDDTELVFYDKVMGSWKFRYCYWKSSQSFVFTRGWNKFVKAKHLKAKDIVTFYTCQPMGIRGTQEGQTFCLIDVIYSSGENNNVVNHVVELEVETNLNLCSNNLLSFEVGRDARDLKEEMVIKRLENSNMGKKEFRLFGVSIN